MAARSWCGFLVTASIVLAAGCTPEVPLPDPVAAPVFSPAGGAYDDVLDVTIATDTGGAGIRYTFDGSTPSSIYGRAYDGFPLTVSSSVTIRAVAWQDGRPDSEVAAVTYALAGTTEGPVFTPDAGAGPFAGAQQVSMSCGTPGAGIWYTTDGSEPRPADGYGTRYLGVPLSISSTTSVKAAAWKPGAAPSMTAEVTYVIQAYTAIDRDGDVGRYSSIAKAAGALLIAYRDDTAGALKIARSVDGGLSWSTRFLDWQGDVGYHVSIAAAGDRVAVAYQEAGAADLRCAVSTDSGATWHRYPVDAAGTTGLYTATAVTDTTICIAYYEAGAADLKLAYSLDDGAGWTLRPLDTSASDVGKYASIAMNGTKVYVAYYDATAGDLRFGWTPTPGGAWVSSALDASGNVGQYASLRYDAASATIWLAYYDVTWSRLKVVKSVPNESSWTLVGVIDDSGATGQYASFSVSGASGQDLAIAYYEDWEYRLKVARSGDTGASWTTEVVAEGGAGQWASIACTGSDGNGKPTYAVSCYDSLAGDLRLARYDGTGWTFH
jgi:hypothetical protein